MELYQIGWRSVFKQKLTVQQGLASGSQAMSTGAPPFKKIKNLTNNDQGLASGSQPMSIGGPPSKKVKSLPKTDWILDYPQKRFDYLRLEPLIGAKIPCLMNCSRWSR